MAFSENRVTKHGEHAKVLRKRAGVWLKGKREEAKLTQQEVAVKLGLKYYTFISQIETGLTRVPPEQLPAYADALGMDRQEFAKALLKFYDPFTYAALFGKK